jgi:anti-anti-sigma factor
VDIKKTGLKDFTVVAISGEMEVYDAESFESRMIGMIEGGAKKIIIDFKGLDYISSSGLRAILNVRSRAQKDGGRLVLAGLKDKVLEVFRVSKLLGIFEVVAASEDVR